MRSATNFLIHDYFIAKFQLTRSIRSATRACGQTYHRTFHFNSRAPCGARPRRLKPAKACRKFQLTRSVRSATNTLTTSPRTLRISTHALHTERDHSIIGFMPRPYNFNSRAPCGARRQRARRTYLRCPFQLTRSIRSATMYNDNSQPVTPKKTQPCRNMMKKAPKQALFHAV